MVKRSSRSLSPRRPSRKKGSTEGLVNTITDFVTLVQSSTVQRVQVQSSEYCSEVLSDEGSQFTVYTDRGIFPYDKPAAVVKCAKLKLGEIPSPAEPNVRRLAASLYKEILVLTHQDLSVHPNVIRLLWYDFIEASETGERLYTPALLLERAQYGSLSDFLHTQFEGLSAGAKIALCSGVTSGLHALHDAGFAHGDVKADNVLIFSLDPSAGTLLAKLTDFGSIIPLTSLVQGLSARYRGTTVFNAPEVDEQAASGQLSNQGLKRCDAYSLGLLILNVVIKYLDQDVLAKDLHVLKNALLHIAQAAASGLLDEFPDIFENVLKLLLVYNPNERCSDLSIVKNLLSPFDATASWLREAFGRTHYMKLKQKRVSNHFYKEFGDALYFEFNLDQEVEAEPDIQDVVFRVLRNQSRSTKRGVAGKAYFQLAIAYAIGFGTKQSVDSMLDSAAKSAQSGYLPAMATTTALYQANHRDLEPSEDEHIEWLSEATAWGSHTASKVLKRLNNEKYNQARRSFHLRGGYNQYFYPRFPPSTIVEPGRGGPINPEIVARAIHGSLDERKMLVEATVIYGDLGLLQPLLQTPGIELNTLNVWGETLLLLGCKAGHLEVLNLLIHAGASLLPAEPALEEPVDPPLQWIVAFDEKDIETAAKLLVQDDKIRDFSLDVLWNHPSIDLPGRFPLGTPLHTAAFCDSSAHMDALLKLIPGSINRLGHSECTPVEYAVPRRKLEAVKSLLAHGALEDEALNTYALAEVGTQLNHEIWANAGSNDCQVNAAVAECIGAVLHLRPELRDECVASDCVVDSSPLIGAVTYQDEATVDALLQRGCNVNVRTDDLYEGKMAVHFLTFNRLQYEDNNIFELLRAAGADLSAATEVGGKLPLHFAARDDCIRIARKLLDSGADIDSTDHFGCTPLHTAAYFGSWHVAKELLEQGANIQAEHEIGNVHQMGWDKLTPIAHAAARYRKAIVELMLAQGALPFARPLTKHTVIHFAVTETSSRMLELLLGIPQLRDASVINSKASNGVTALHLCAGNLGRHEHIKALLNVEADVSLTTPDGHSVLDIAINTHAEVKRCLSTDKPLINLDPVLRTSVVEPNYIAETNEGRFSFALQHDLEPIDGQGSEEMEDDHPSVTSDLDQLNIGVEEEEPVFDLELESEKWEATIRLLEDRGARRMCADPVPTRAFSLFQNSLNNLLHEKDI